MASDDEKRRVTQWMFGGDTGLSSEFLARAFLLGEMGGRWGRPDYPQDPSDFGRCFRLLMLNPAIREVFPKVRESCLEWQRIIDHWAAIEALYLEEYPSGRAPKCYALMDKLIREDNPRYARKA